MFFVKNVNVVVRVVNNNFNIILLLYIVAFLLLLPFIHHHHHHHHFLIVCSQFERLSTETVMLPMYENSVPTETSVILHG